MLETQPQIVEAYVKSGRVKMVFRHLLDFGDPSLLASQAAECAGDQGKFWQMHGLIYQRQNFVFNGNAALYQKWSKEDLKIDDAVFGACMSANKHKAKIEGQYAAARAAGVRVRPTFDINGKRLQGALPFGEFQKAIDAIK